MSVLFTDKAGRREAAIRMRRRALLAAGVLTGFGALTIIGALAGTPVGDYLPPAWVPFTGGGLLLAAWWAVPGRDEDGEPLELRDASRKHRQLRRLAAQTADPQQRGAVLAEAIHGDAVAFCEVDDWCGCTIAHLRGGETITFTDFSDPTLREVSHGHY